MALAGTASRVNQAHTGSFLAFLRDGARILRSSLRSVPRLQLFDFVSRIFSLQRRMELAFLASGATTQLADAALGGETTSELAARISRIARTLAGAAGAAVHLRGQGGVQKLGADG